MLVSFVIPAYDEENNISETLDELSKRMDFENAECEYIVVDDHSTDATYKKIEEMRNDSIRCIRLCRRSGSHTAIRAGLKHARGDVVICMSADGQDNPRVIEEMLSQWKDGCDIVWALCKDRDNERWYVKYLALAFYFLIMRICTVNSEHDLSRANFYMLDRKVVDSINDCPELNTSLFGLIVWMGYRQGSVEYDRRERRSGHSKWNLKSRFRLALDWIIAFSGLPLRLISIFGVFLAFLGILYTIVIIINSVLGTPVHGWASIMVAILLLSGCQLVMIGVLGEYLWRCISESRRRPLYFIEADTQQKKSKVW